VYLVRFSLSVFSNHHIIINQIRNLYKMEGQIKHEEDVKVDDQKGEELRVALVDGRINKISNGKETQKQKPQQG
jgi:hypothetical protein